MVKAIEKKATVKKVVVKKIDNDAIVLPTKRFSMENLDAIYALALKSAEFDKNTKKFNNVNIDACIEYVNAYFYRVEGQTLFYQAHEKEFRTLSTNGFHDTYTNFMPEEIKKYLTSRSTRVCDIINEPDKPLIFKKDNFTYINLSSGFKFKNVKPYSTYSDSIKKGVDRLLIANGVKNVSKYLRRWISKMCKGERNQALLYLKSIEGTGKSTFVEILIGMLGMKIATTLNAYPLITPYSGCMRGQL